MATINGTFNSLISGTLAGTIGTPGPQGPAGPQGPQGDTGPAGPGLPVGGTAGQIIVKASDTDYDTVWTDNSAETLTATVRNITGSTLSKGTVVYINGGAGNKPTVTKASASSESSSSKTFAILSEDIPTNQNGLAVTVGLLKGVDTSAFSDGANLWLSTTAGEITATMPTTPNHAVFLGNAVRIHANQGEIQVRIQNGLELGELHDVLLTSPTNGQVLKYDSASGLWVNGTDSSGVAWGGITGTLSSQTDLNTALGLKYDASNPSGFITSAALSPYLTSATAASTYQTIAGMSSYLTTSSAASTYYPLSGNPSGFLTSSALTPYLTSATAASTYYPLTNPSGYITSSALSPYLTSATASSTYQTISGMSSYLAKADNLSGLASTSTARTNLGLGSISTINDAPSDGTTYGRQNGAWVAAGGGGGGWTPGSGDLNLGGFNVYTGNGPYLASMGVNQLLISLGTPTIGLTTTQANHAYSAFQVSQTAWVDDGSGNPTAWTDQSNYVSNGEVGGYFNDIGGGTYYEYHLNPYELYLTSPAGTMRYGNTQIQFVDGTVQSTAASPFPDAPYDGNYYVRQNGAWFMCNVVSIYNQNDGNTYNCLTV